MIIIYWEAKVNAEGDAVLLPVPRLRIRMKRREVAVESQAVGVYCPIKIFVTSRPKLM